MGPLGTPCGALLDSSERHTPGLRRSLSWQGCSLPRGARGRTTLLWKWAYSADPLAGGNSQSVLLRCGGSLGEWAAWFGKSPSRGEWPRLTLGSAAWHQSPNAGPRPYIHAQGRGHLGPKGRQELLAERFPSDMMRLRRAPAPAATAKGLGLQGLAGGGSTLPSRYALLRIQKSQPYFSRWDPGKQWCC